MKVSRMVLVGSLLLACASCSKRAEQPAPEAEAQTQTPAAAVSKPISPEPGPPAAASTAGGALQEFSAALKKAAQPGGVSEAEKKLLEDSLSLVLPSQDFIGEDNEWHVGYSDMDDNDFFQVDLRRKGAKSFDKLIWFHILYKSPTPSFYGSEEFEGYRGAGAEGMHYFILVGNVEIRAVASADEFKDDEKIKDMLRAFDLAAISKL